ncbi:MAG: sugar transferase [Gammaproteobacteria bacterium]|jgi:Sugar transferases involved in lipopolysaccharide synthesis|nr:sugar transferase [Gammaproteobacteria bacterium]
MDVVLSATMLVILSPLLLTIAAIVLVDLGLPVFFRHTRPGLRGVPFSLIKFRTMRELRDIDGRLLANEVRLTRIGRFLRSTSLDELPELWNVLKGDMSLVGPRPLLIEYLPMYTATQSRRHEVRPGITGWAQVNGRNTVSWEERFQMDVWYVDNRTLWLDLRILALTIGKVLSREGISVPGKATIDRFKASK